jgi:cysteine desulfurase
MAGRAIIYLDNNATTRLDDAVLEAMLPYFAEDYANASSMHAAGSRARAAVDVARGQIARLIGAAPEEIVFTSGATESVNLALKGMAEALASRGRHIVTVATEHKAVLDSCEVLARAGFEITHLGVDAQGRVRPEDLVRALKRETILVSVMAANNEIGTLAPLREIGQLCREHGVAFHSDATQAVGRIAIDLTSLPIDLLSFSAHKMHGPKGVGALVVRARRGVPRPVAQMHGGGHQEGLRSGTLNVPAIVGFGRAASLAAERLEADASLTRSLRDHLVAGLCERLEGVHPNGQGAEGLPHTASLTFSGVRADRILSELKEIAASTGSACSSARPEPSHVLRAIGLPREEVLSTVRFGVSRYTTPAEIDAAIERIVGAVHTLRDRSSGPALETSPHSFAELHEGNHHA